MKRQQEYGHDFAHFKGKKEKFVQKKTFKNIKFFLCTEKTLQGGINTVYFKYGIQKRVL